MNTDGYNKTDGRQSEDGASSGAETDKILGNEGCLTSHGAVAAGADPMAGAIDAMQEADEAEKRKPGRRKGALNRRSEALARWAERTYAATPGQVIVATALHGLPEHLAAGRPMGTFQETRAKQLARALDIEDAAAFAAIQDALKAASRFTDAPLPPAKDAGTKPLVFAQVTSDGTVTDGSGGGGSLDLRPQQLRLSSSKSDKK
jgi:hypothetical protein